MKLVVMENHEEMSKYACQLIVSKVNSLTSPVLGLATGSTPERLYEMLIEEYKQKLVSFSRVKTFNLDEYVGLRGHDKNSYRYYMDHHLFSKVNFTKRKNHIPNGMASQLEQECQRYEQLIKEAGGIDLQILGLGHNGHIGFNEPGTPFSSRTHVVDLDCTTREANARFFESIKEVPTQAITMGIETILESKQIILLVSGEQKATAMQRLLNGEVSEDFPASVLKRHHDVTIIADKAALQLQEDEQLAWQQ
ncbi:glucosamine-6-phosphate deaminase [Alkalihalobacterium chitinilyticum]|uniref:Glucosamine-6-phosphate deaminase n=1 Tax=Alkalihalobacterium chitinilyticum TaxID=2980103 RepID=A0ABT5VD81_9BACI|nr:glucosamine-6-phosphate deaminase [Alkalihalobacterium chitinilyticum]MDE5413394.1 glucosamine-6-phosphate deaminase [Alkalihalobacterium chitinilyticum]